MTIKHAMDPVTGVEYINEFEAYDARMRKVGSSRVDSMVCKRMFPARPHQVRIEVELSNRLPQEQYVAVRSGLLGAASAQAIIYAAEMRMPARIYAPCAPDDEAYLEQLGEFGYEDNDGVVRMVKMVREEPKEPVLLDGVVSLQDNLRDPVEAKFFLQRYNQLFGVEESMELVEEWTQDEMFRRYLLIDEEGLLGEVLATVHDGVGRILFLQVNSECSRSGLGRYLLEKAIYELYMDGADRIDMDVRVSIPYIMRMLKKLGFEQHTLLCRYPGMNWDAAREKRLLERHVRDAEDALEFDVEDEDEEKEAPIAQDPSDWDW